LQFKQAGFFGDKSQYVMSGSDEGAVVFWDSKTGGIIQAIKGDSITTNCVLQHPSLPLLVTSGIDSDIKIFLPSAAKPRSQASLEYFFESKET